MKKIFVALFAFISLFMLVSCGGDSPKAVVKKWQDALVKGDLKTANELTTEKSRELNGLIAGMISGDKDKLEEFKNTKYDKEDITGDKAVVSSGDDDDSKVELIKQDGKWLVDVNKN